MHTADLIRLYPEVFHMAVDGSWPSIERHGLLSSATIVEQWEVAPDARRERLLSERRDESYVLEHPIHGGVAVVRDQKPIHEPSLAEALDDMAPVDWYDELNSRVFFFLQRHRLIGLQGARSYRKDIHTVITLDTATLVERYESSIELCAINSGFAQPHNKARRGSKTFRSIHDYPHPERAEPRQNGYDVAELTVRGGVTDLDGLVVRVDRMHEGDVIERLV
ncbi:DUF7002 family protein [Agromyces humatus]|uniref:DUF7002 family protein n=1 Tax=Agromyces humatus TaxID=279573 RepID=UPI001E2C7D8D|nr:hypothetical protein [Agromyces humatus]